MLTVDATVAALTDLLGAPPPYGAIEHAYTMLRCSGCTLEFADPPLPGNSAFYGWVTGWPQYYPGERWEWQRVLELLRGPGIATHDILEVGCGSGAFLERLRNAGALRASGIDSEPGAIAACKRQGLDASCISIEDYLTSGHARRFDTVVMFHCLEHVAEPVRLVTALLALTTTTGRVFISTPYSPMSFEGAWLDPLNHPPHHLTRWNARSYAALAKRCALRLRLYMPRPAGTLSRALASIALAERLPRPVSRLTRARLALSGPVRLARELARQHRRERVDGRHAADVVLVELSRA